MVVFRSVTGNWALQVFEGSSKALPVRSPSEASKKSPCLDASGRPVKRAFAVDVGADFEIELMEAAESVGDVNFHLCGIDGFVVSVGDGEVGGAGAQSGIDCGNGMRVWRLRLGGGNQQEQR